MAGRGDAERLAAPVIALKPRPAARHAEERDEPVRHHRVETIQRGRRVAAEPGDTEIILPDWLGPLSEPDTDAAPLRARQAG
ncbi:hypothetical protein ACFQY4_42600 [Catellatospora bangladeshensis]|uniref:Uncharacterized protein n=1 Tax=Catellatospora bangladeshensis TaxID=310355 RepID=A0A8J3JK05_9ACTN|nr:hypothetical protein [Catellatospora bangladeshensis]GIF80013.1 hypothetical protein Cba03nite_13620 [Catellatospora bangladeshensis]